MSDPETFWRELPEALAAAEQLPDADAAETLIDFLEDFRHVWPAIVSSMRLTAAKRALVERSILVLAEPGGPRFVDTPSRFDDSIPGD
jgi:hypothetical protein